MTRIQSALAAMLLIRHEHQPPIIRYTILLALADKHPQPMTGMEICDATRDDAVQNSTLDKMVEHGLVTRHHKGKQARTYTLTALGQAEAARVIQGNPKPKPTPKPDLAKAASAAMVRGF